MQHTTNYQNTFIEVADDCPTETAQIPPEKGNEKSVAGLQFEMIRNNPYKLTSDEIIFGIYALRKGIGENAFDNAKEQFFSKGQPCMRSSPLGKRYGWGIHSNEEGKIAVYAVESEEYKKLSADISLKHLKAMRTSLK